MIKKDNKMEQAISPASFLSVFKYDLDVYAGNAGFHYYHDNVKQNRKIYSMTYSIGNDSVIIENNNITVVENDECLTEFKIISRDMMKSMGYNDILSEFPNDEHFIYFRTIGENKIINTDYLYYLSMGYVDDDEYTTRRIFRSTDYTASNLVAFISRIIFYG